MKKSILFFTFTFLISYFTLAQCPAGQWAVEVNITPDSYPNETSWNLFANNVEVGNGTIYNDTLCIDSSACIQFVIQDAYGDGICCGYGLGSYSVVLNGEQVANGGEFTTTASHSFNCPLGSVCENPYSIDEGEYLASQTDTYYSFTPDSTGIYSISTCGLTTCDTYLWVYTDCSAVDITGGNSGSLYNNDDDPQCGTQSTIEALLSAENTYIIRVGMYNGASCDGGIPFSLNYLSDMTSVLPIVKLTTLQDAINNDIKVPVAMQIIDNGPGQINTLSDTNFAYEGQILTEWQGFTGPFYPKKNYDFDLIDDLGNKIDTSLLGMPAENDWIFKAEYLDNNIVINTVAYEFARRMGRYAPRTRLCEIFLDGQYIGVYTLTEKVKRNQNRVDIAKLLPSDISGSELTGGYIIEMNINGDPGAWNSVYPPINSATNGNPVEFKYVYPKSDEIMPEQAEYIKAFVDSFENALNADAYLSPTWGYRNWIDVSTFIDFLIVNEFTMNFDSYGRSTYMYKEKDTDGGKLCIGPAWDYDRAMASDPAQGWVWEITHEGWPFPFWWSKMNTDEVYQHELACRWKSLRADVYSTANFHAFIDSVSALLFTGPAERNFSIWQTLNPSAYPDQIQNMKNWLADRLNWMDQTLEPYGAELPLVAIPESLSGCFELSFEAPLNPDWNYNWVPGPETPNISFTTSGLYHLEISDAYGCYVDSPVLVELSNPDSTFITIAENNGYGFEFTAQDDPNSSYTWVFGDGSSVQYGMTTHHDYLAIGTYTVTLTVIDSDGCEVSSSQIVNVTTTSTEELNQPMQWSLYPNPVQEDFIVEIPSAHANKQYSLSITNPMGQVIMRIPVIGVKTTIELGSQFSSGLYILQLHNAKGSTIISQTWMKL